MPHFVSEVTLLSSFVPRGWLPCDGRSLDDKAYPKLANLVGTAYGAGAKAGSSFNVPDLRGRSPFHATLNSKATGAYHLNPPLGVSRGRESVALHHTELGQHRHDTLSSSVILYGESSLAGSTIPDDWAFSVRTPDTYSAGTASSNFGDDSVDVDAVVHAAGEGEPHENMPPFLALHMGIVTDTVGVVPSQEVEHIKGIPGEIRMLASSVLPKGWMPCEGHLLSVAHYPELFAALGTTYGGDGRMTFGTPDFKAQIPVGTRGPSGGDEGWSLGQEGGEAMVATGAPAHTHLVTADVKLWAHDKAAAAALQRANTVLAKPTQNLYVTKTTAAVDLHTSAASIDVEVGSHNGGLKHDNVSPWNAVNFIMAMGVYAKP